MLSETHLNQFKTDGYCVHEGFLTESEVARLVKEMDIISAGATLAKHDPTRLEMEPKQAPDGTKVRRIYEPCTYYDLFREFSNSPRMLDCVEQLIGPDVVYIYSKINVKPAEIGSIVEWHQDMAYGPWTNRSGIAGLMYMDDADIQNGCLQVIPGQFRMLDHSRDGFFQGKITQPLDTSKAVPVEAKRGSIIFFNGLVPHASSPNLSLRPRRTLILGYRAADAFPIHFGESTAKGQMFCRLVRGKQSNVARFDMDWSYIPRYPAETKSLYELQELSHRHESSRPV